MRLLRKLTHPGAGRLRPAQAFPQEVLELQQQGVPLPDWYCGPLYTGSREDEREAMEQLQRVRARAGSEQWSGALPQDETSPSW